MVAPPVQRLVTDFTAFGSQGSVLGALSETKFVCIDYITQEFLLYEIVDGAPTLIDSVAHLYEQIPNEGGGVEASPPVATRWAETAVPISAFGVPQKRICYAGFHPGDFNVNWSVISLDGSGMLSVQTEGTSGWGYATENVYRVVADASGDTSWAWELYDGTTLANAPNSGVVDGINSGTVGTGMLVAYKAPSHTVVATGSGTWPPTVTLTCGANTLTFTHPTGSRVHDEGDGNIIYESTLQYLPIGNNQVVILGTTNTGLLTYRTFSFDASSMAWETDWATVTLPAGFAGDEYPRAATWDGTVLAIGYVEDIWG